MIRRESGYVDELAPLKLATPVKLDWKAAPIGARQITGLAIRHVKVAQHSVPTLVAALTLPGAGRIANVGPVECFWIGPGEWLMLAAAERHDELGMLERNASEHGAAGIAVEDRLTVLQVDATADLLCALTGLTAETLAAGRVARTRLADIPVIIAAGPVAGFRLLFDRTFAPHMRGWLDRAI
jgi:heterotetrameric sarcosine oxidase gamma subunit